MFREPADIGGLNCIDKVFDNEIPRDINKVDCKDTKINQLRRVNSAVRYLSRRGLRQQKALSKAATTTASTASSHSSYLPEPPIQPLFFGKALVVPQRSDLWIDGFHNKTLDLSDLDDALYAKDISLSRKSLRRLQLRGLILLCTAYGAAHLCAWNNAFPSTTEKWLWRVSALCMAASPSSFFVCYAIAKARVKWTGQSRAWEPEGVAGRILARIADFGLFLGAPILGTLAMGTYLVGRPYVLVEGFASLRSPANGTYVTPSWTLYFPHLG